MASKERAGVVDNSAKSAKSGGSAGRRVTAPIYNGTQTSAHVASAASTSVLPVSGVSLAAQIYSRADSLRYATSELSETLQRLGLYEPAPSKGEDLASAAHDNVLRVINEELNGAMRFANNVLFSSVHGDDEEEIGEDCDTEKETQGAIHKTQFGRSIYGDAQAAISRLLSIQSLANRVNLSLVGVEGPADCRAAQVNDSVHGCLCNLADHIDDTVTTLHRVNADLMTNLLGVNGQ